MSRNIKYYIDYHYYLDKQKQKYPVHFLEIIYLYI